MKAHFKYSLMDGVRMRFPFFCAVLGMMLAASLLRFFGLLPDAAHIAAVSLGGIGIGVLSVVSIISDISILRRMFSAPGAYLYALTPAPRRQILLASVVSVLILDMLTMTPVIIGEVWLSFNLTNYAAGESFQTILAQAFALVMWGDAWAAVWAAAWSALYALSGYVVLLLVILLSITAKKSVFYKRRASGLLAFLLGWACFYLFSLLPLLLIPLGAAYDQYFTVSFNVYLSGAAHIAALILLNTLFAAGLFAVCAKWMERKINI